MLLLAAVGLEALFVVERRAGLAAVEAERARVREVASRAFERDLLGALDVAEARIEALETLPLLDASGLVLARGGLQWLPRLAGQRRAAPVMTPALEAALATVPPEVRARILDGATRGEVPQLEQPLPRHSMNALLDALQGKALEPVTRLAWLLVLTRSAADTTPKPEWLQDVAGPGRPRAGAIAPLEGLQSALLRAWPWLPADAASRWCLAVRQQGEAAGASTVALDAACAQGFTGRRLEVQPSEAPRLIGNLLTRARGDAVLGVELNLAERLAAVTKAGREAGLLAPDDVLAVPAGPSELSRLSLLLASPRLDAREAGHRATFVWKTGFVLLSLALALAVVALSALTARRKEATLAAQRDFIATVSHELRTPLATVRLLAETLERRLEGAEAARDYPRRLVEAADGLTFLVDNILSFHRVESGRWVPKREPYAFSSLEALLDSEVELAPEEVQLSVDASGLQHMAPHHLDPLLLALLVRNLMRNAWKYGQRRPVRFSVRGRDEGATAVLEFSDNGPGIPRAAWESVFTPFHRLAGEDGRSAGGAGLGLALARRVAELHGGTLRITASSSEGTTFTLRLPRT